LGSNIPFPFFGILKSFKGILTITDFKVILSFWGMMLMCRACSGNPPDPLSFNSFRKSVLQAIRNVSNPTEFVNEAIKIDELRFNTGDEWGESHICREVNNLIFNNPDPGEGLLLFILSCWLDMQAQYITVWTTYLRQARNWIKDKGVIPRGDYSPTKSHLLLTRDTVRSYGNISRWFIQKINAIVQENGQSRGNLYRLVGEMCNDLYSKPEVVDSLKWGHLPSNFSGGDHKRFWMLMMFLRRDNSVVKCLFTRALNKFPDGQKIIQYWYDSRYFDPKECELPVDGRVSTNWNRILSKIGMSNLRTENRSNVAKRARAIADENNISPSVFDAILFYSM